MSDTEMTEVVAKDPQKVGFASRPYMGRQQQEALEYDPAAEKAEADAAANNPEGDEQVDTKDLSGEEKTWAERYAHLRRMQAKERREAEAREKEWQKKYEQTTKGELKLPKSDEDIAKFQKDHPDVYDLILSLARKEAMSMREDTDKTVEELETIRHELRMTSAYKELLKLQPEFEVIRDDPKFTDWLETAPKRLQDALYNGDDPDAASDAIDLFKLRTGWNKEPAKKKPSAAEAASGVKTRDTGAPVGNTDGEWSESKVQALSLKDYEKNEQAIYAAMTSGKFVYDITGKK